MPLIRDRGVVVVAHFSSLDRALEIFKREVGKAGIFGELRRRTAYTPPGERRRIKARRAAAKRRKDAAQTARRAPALANAARPVVMRG